MFGGGASVSIGFIVKGVSTADGLTAVANPVDLVHSVPTSDCHVAVRGDDTLIAHISGFMNGRLGTRAGLVGKRLKALYTFRYGAVTGTNIPEGTQIVDGNRSLKTCTTRETATYEEAIEKVAPTKILKFIEFLFVFSDQRLS